MKTWFSLSAMALGLVIAGTASAEQSGPPDTAVGRLEALAIVSALNAELLSHDSATLTLDRWCASHKLAATPKIVAHLDPGIEKPADAGVRKLLGVTDSEPVKYRRVKLGCGDRVLSEADNWYVPARLTAEMNHVLETTDTAFGRAVKDLHFQRHTISAELLWQPLPDGWDMGGDIPPPTSGTLDIPKFVIQHRAFLTRADGLPFSVVVESYTRDVLAFPWPKIGG